MSFDVDTLQQHIPYYLTAEDQRVLVNELKALASGGKAKYVLDIANDSFRSDMLQGDGWKGFQLFLFDSGERRSVQGLVLSNSCDVDPHNKRDFPSRIIFVPLVKLADYEKLLRNSKIDTQKIEDKISSIKAQKTTNIFYLPAGGPLSEDYVARFDETHSMSMRAHAESQDKEKLFTLSNTGFYMLILKLSVHFCRLQEKVNRKPAALIA